MVTQRKFKHLKPLVKKYSLSLYGTVLDAGCGYGGRSIEISKEVGAHVISIDVSLRCLKALNSQKGAYNIDIIRADVQNLPLKDFSVDKIMCVDVLEHVPNVSKTLKEFQRTIRNAGTIFLLVPSKLSQKLFFRLDNKYAEHTGHLRIFGTVKLLNLVKSAGFCVINRHYAEFFRAIYHLLQVLSKSRIEHQTGRAITESTGLSTIWKISRVLYYSRVGDLMEVVGKFIFPNSFIVIATKTGEEQI